MKITDLISQACEKVGNSTRLAEVLDVPQPAISMWKKGTRPCPPEEQARIAELIGLDPIEALINAVLERHAGTAKGEALSQMLKRQNKKPPEFLQGANFGGNGRYRTGQAGFFMPAAKLFQAARGWTKYAINRAFNDGNRNSVTNAQRLESVAA